MLKGNGYMVCPAGIHGVEETTDLEEAREMAADLASMYGKAIIYTALEVVKPNRNVTARQTRLGAAVLPTLEREEAKAKEVPGMLRAAHDEEDKEDARRKKEAEAEVNAIAPDDPASAA